MTAVLIVEDEPGLREGLVAAVETLKYRALPASGLAEARQQAEEIMARARRSAEAEEREASEEAKAKREQMLEQTRRDIEAETRRAIQEIRREVADLTVMATEKVTRKTLTEDDQRRLIDDALSELDFSSLAADGEGR